MPTSANVVTLGAAFSANKGAASMLQALIDRLPELVGPCEITVLTTYPRDDRASNLNQDVRVVSLTPRELVFPVIPLAVLVWFSRLVGLSGSPFLRTRSLKAISEADVVADLAGISFSDGRGLPILVYNILMTGLPLLLGKPTVKCSQAIGPFDETPTRWAARWILPRLEAVVARGSQTRVYLDSLGLDNVHSGDDLAFLMQVDDSAEKIAARALDPVGHQRFVCVAPSAVVDEYCKQIGVDYEGLMVDFCDWLTQERGLAVVLIAHSFRDTGRQSRMNDMPLCERLVERTITGAGVHLLDGDLSPAVLRAVISKSAALVTSRFHGMISALATRTPVLVVGWSHKYEEVLTEFDLAEYALRYNDLAPDTFRGLFSRIIDNADGVRAKIDHWLPQVERSADVSLTLLADIVLPAG